MLCAYGLVGTGTKVDEIKTEAPIAIEKRGWKILRYEGYQWGSFAKHGGKVWYHVCNSDNPNIQYRVHVTKWGGELHFYYNEPETLQRVNANISITK